MTNHLILFLRTFDFNTKKNQNQFFWKSSLKKIIYIYRSKQPGRYSIEEIYQRISAAVGKRNHDTHNYYYNQGKSLIGNIISLLKMKTDVYHITGDISYFGIFLPKKKTVLTYHDIGRYKELTGWKKWVFGLIWVRLPAYRVNKIIAISNFTKQDLIKYFKIPTSKIEVIHNPVPENFVARERKKKRAIPRILQIGTGANKNLPILIDALEGIECELIIIGTIDQEIIDQLEHSNVRFENFKHLSNQEIYKHYLEADLVTFVSLHEGFGMIIIEANATGRPVISSNVTSIPEVAQDAALLVNPTDVGAVKKGILSILNDESLKNKLVANGIKNIKRFQEKDIVDKYLEIYHHLD